MSDQPITVINYAAPELNHLAAGLAAEGLLSRYLAPLVLPVLMAHLRRQHLWRRPTNFAHRQGYRSE